MWDKIFICGDAEYAELINYETASPCLCNVAVKLRRVKSAGKVSQGGILLRTGKSLSDP